MPATMESITEDNFPCFVKCGSKMERLKRKLSSKEKYHVIARNSLRHLTYGGAFFEAKLLNLKVFNGLALYGDPKLLNALKTELTNIFSNICNYIENKQLKGFNEGAEKRLEIFINHLLAAYPYMDPEESDTILLPQKINNEWEAVPYRFKKLDISPQTGFLNAKRREKRRLYAYGLETTHPLASPYLLLMGSTYPAAKGAVLNWLENFAPQKSVGEGHDMTHIDAWINHPANQRIKISGHSKGGTMAMIVAARHANKNKIQEANCLNPTALCRETIERLSPIWDNTPPENRPAINVFTQLYDPVFDLGKTFLAESHFFQIVQKNAEQSNRIAAHAHYQTGFAAATIEEITRTNIATRTREFNNHIKKTANWCLYPAFKLKDKFDLCMDEVTDTLHYPLLQNTALGIGFGLQAIALTIISALTTLAIGLTGCYALLKIGVKSLMGYYQPSKVISLTPKKTDYTPTNSSTAHALKNLPKIVLDENPLIEVVSNENQNNSTVSPNPPPQSRQPQDEHELAFSCKR